MKKTIFTITIGTLAVLACSNKKDPQPAPKSATELLTAHPWRPASQQDSTGKDIPLRECEKDDSISFLINNFIETAEGKNICDKGEESVRENKWYLEENDTKIWFYKANFKATILKLTDDSLILKDDFSKMISKASK